LAPIVGEALIGDAPAHRLAPAKRARKLAYLPQSRPLAWAISVEALVRLGRHALPPNEPAIDRAIDACALEPLRRRSARTLSGGELARAHLARTLAAETTGLIADEPTAALDPRHALAVMQILADRAANGAAVLAAVHDLSLAARFATRVAVLHEGRLVADAAPPEALTPEVLASVFGVQGGLSPDGRQVLIDGPIPPVAP
jgi:iron complex transport system ATP-binding protein